MQQVTYNLARQMYLELCRNLRVDLVDALKFDIKFRSVRLMGLQCSK